MSNGQGNCVAFTFLLQSQQQQHLPQLNLSLLLSRTEVFLAGVSLNYALDTALAFPGPLFAGAGLAAMALLLCAFAHLEHDRSTHEALAEHAGTARVPGTCLPLLDHSPVQVSTVGHTGSPKARRPGRRGSVLSHF